MRGRVGACLRGKQVSLTLLLTFCLTRVAQPDNHHQTACDRRDTQAFEPTDAPDLPAVLRAYTAFHASARACLVAAACPSSILVWDGQPGELYSGVGDRLRGIRSSFLVAVATQRVFLIDWPRGTALPFPLSAGMQPAHLDWRPPPGLAGTRFLWASSGSRVEHAGPNITSRALDIARDDLAAALPARVVRMSNRLPRVSLLALARNPHAHQLRALSGVPLRQLEHMLTTALFRASALVETAVRVRVFRQPFVAVHARTGLDVGEWDDRRHAAVQKNLQEYTQALFNCSVAGGAMRVFLAGDSVRVKRGFRELARRSGVSVRSRAGRVRHGGKIDDGFRDGFRERAARCREFVDVFADLFALGRGSRLVSLNSSFAVAALAVGGPRRWSVVEDDGAGGLPICRMVADDL